MKNALLLALTLLLCVSCQNAKYSKADVKKIGFGKKTVEEKKEKILVSIKKKQYKSFKAKQKVTFNAKKINTSFICAIEADTEKNSFKIAALGEMGGTLFILSVKEEGAETLFKAKGFENETLNAFAKDLHSLYLTPFSAKFEVYERGKGYAILYEKEGERKEYFLNKSFLVKEIRSYKQNALESIIKITHKSDGIVSSAKIINYSLKYSANIVEIKITKKGYE